MNLPEKPKTYADVNPRNDEDTRPRRETERYGWPVPGDTDPADVVTDLGDGLDGVDDALGALDDRTSLPIIEHTVRGQNDLPANAPDGTRVLVRIQRSSLSVAGATAVNTPVWELIRAFGAWYALSGTPLLISDYTASSGQYGGVGTWAWHGPNIWAPYNNMIVNIRHGVRLRLMAANNGVLAHFQPTVRQADNIRYAGHVGWETSNTPLQATFANEYQTGWGGAGSEELGFFALATSGANYGYDLRWAMIMPSHINI